MLKGTGRTGQMEYTQRDGVCLVSQRFLYVKKGNCISAVTVSG